MSPEQLKTTSKLLDALVEAVNKPRTLAAHAGLRDHLADVLVPALASYIQLPRDTEPAPEPVYRYPCRHCRKMLFSLYAVADPKAVFCPECASREPYAWVMLVKGKEPQLHLMSYLDPRRVHWDKSLVTYELLYKDDVPAEPAVPAEPNIGSTRVPSDQLLRWHEFAADLMTRAGMASHPVIGEMYRAYTASRKGGA